MALKQSEKTLVGVALIAAGIALVVAVGLPQFDAYNASNTELTGLKDELTGLETQKTSLAAQIKILEKNTDIPTDIKVITFTPDTREQMIKQMLNQVVELASATSNVFISLSPVEVAPFPGTAEAATKADADGSASKGEGKDTAASDTASADADTNADASGADGESKEPPPPPAPTLSTFGYELAVRGTYDTIQKFLQEMTKQKDLMEILQVTLENEATASSSRSSGSNASLANSKAPIKLTATLRLAMQQVDP